MANEKNIAIRLSLKDGETVRRALMQLGDDGQKALARIESASAPASKGLLALNAASGQVQAAMGGMAGRVGILGDALSAIGPGGLVAAAAIGGVFVALSRGVREAEDADITLARLQAVLKATGNAAGLTAGELSGLADEMEMSTLATAEGVKDASSIMATFKSVSGDTFTRAIRLSQDLSAVFKQDLTSSATQLGKALEDPVEGITALKRVGISFTAAQKDMIQAMVDAGDQAGAQRVILDALEKQVGGAGAAEAGGLTGSVHKLEASWGNLLETLARTGAVGGAANTILKGMISTIEDLDRLLKGPDISQQVAIKSKLLVQAQRELDRLQSSGSTDANQIEGLRRDASRISGEIDALVAKGRAEMAALEAEQDQAAQGKSDAERQRNSEAIGQRIKDLEKAKVQAATESADKIRAVNAQLAVDIEKAQKKAALPGVDQSSVDQEISLLRDIATRKIAAIQKPLDDAAMRARDQTAKVLADLQIQLNQAGNPRQSFIDQEMAKLPKTATAQDRAQAEELANKLYRQKEAIKELNEELDAEMALRQKGKQITEQHASAEDAYTAKVKELDELLANGAINQETYAKAHEDAEKRKLAASKDAADGIKRALQSYAESAKDNAKMTEQITINVFRGIEDYAVQAATKGKLSFSNMVDSIIADFTRMSVRKGFTGPASDWFSSFDFSSMFGANHGGGYVAHPTFMRSANPIVFAGAPRLHGGGNVGLAHGERPIIALDTERVLTRAQQDNTAATIAGLAKMATATPAISVSHNVYNQAQNTRVQAQSSWGQGGALNIDVIVEEMETRMARNVGRGEGMAPTLERRYGLNPAAGTAR